MQTAAVRLLHHVVQAAAPIAGQHRRALGRHTAIPFATQAPTPGVHTADHDGADQSLASRSRPLQPPEACAVAEPARTPGEACVHPVSHGGNTADAAAFPLSGKGLPAVFPGQAYLQQQPEWVACKPASGTIPCDGQRMLLFVIATAAGCVARPASTCCCAPD